MRIRPRQRQMRMIRLLLFGDAELRKSRVDLCSPGCKRLAAINSGPEEPRSFGIRKKSNAFKFHFEGRRIHAGQSTLHLPDQFLVHFAHKLERYRSEERRVGKECRSRWSP